MPWIGNGAGRDPSVLGYERNPELFWREYCQKWPEQISPENLKLMWKDAVKLEGFRNTPRVNPAWIQFHPQHAAYEWSTRSPGERPVLEHHHLGQGSRAVALPEELHDAYRTFHPKLQVVGDGDKPLKPVQPLQTGKRYQRSIDRDVRRGNLRSTDPKSDWTRPAKPPNSALAGRPASELRPPGSRHREAAHRGRRPAHHRRPTRGRPEEARFLPVGTEGTRTGICHRRQPGAHLSGHRIGRLPAVPRRPSAGTRLLAEFAAGVALQEAAAGLVVLLGLEAAAEPVGWVVTMSSDQDDQPDPATLRALDDALRRHGMEVNEHNRDEVYRALRDPVEIGSTPTYINTPTLAPPWSPLTPPPPAPAPDHSHAHKHPHQQDTHLEKNQAHDSDHALGAHNKQDDHKKQDEQKEHAPGKAPDELKKHDPDKASSEHKGQEPGKEHDEHEERAPDKRQPNSRAEAGHEKHSDSRKHAGAHGHGSSTATAHANKLQHSSSTPVAHPGQHEGSTTTATNDREADKAPPAGTRDKVPETTPVTPEEAKHYNVTRVYADGVDRADHTSWWIRKDGEPLGDVHSSTEPKLTVTKHGDEIYIQVSVSKDGGWPSGPTTRTFIWCRRRPRATPRPATHGRKARANRTNRRQRLQDAGVDAAALAPASVVDRGHATGKLSENGTFGSTATQDPTAERRSCHTRRTRHSQTPAFTGSHPRNSRRTTAIRLPPTRRRTRVRRPRAPSRRSLRPAKVPFDSSAYHKDSPNTPPLGEQQSGGPSAAAYSPDSSASRGGANQGPNHQAGHHGNMPAHVEHGPTSTNAQASQPDFKYNPRRG